MSQLSFTALSGSFKLSPKRKTLKTELTNTSMPSGNDFVKALNYIQNGNEEGYTAIEFKCMDCYVVIAKLKDKG
jgi:hypothetical protein